MNKKVLIIDDEDWFIEPILDRLAFEEIVYNYFKTGFEGLMEFKSNSSEYSVIILDMKLTLGDYPDGIESPEIDTDCSGLYILKELREINSQIPILCYTVLHDQKIKNEITNLGGTHIVKAGRNEDELFDEIHKFISPNKES